MSRTNGRLLKWLFQVSTPASAASILVVGTTGVLMFLHLGQEQVQDLHEWAGLAMVAILGLHIARHWRSLLNYGRRGASLQVSLAVAALGAAVFLGAAFSGMKRGGLDALRARVEQAPLAELAPLLDETPDRLVARLRRAGFEGVTPETSPAQIAHASKQDGRAVLEALIADSGLGDQR